MLSQNEIKPERVVLVSGSGEIKTPKLSLALFVQTWAKVEVMFQESKTWVELTWVAVKVTASIGVDV